MAQANIPLLAFSIILLCGSVFYLHRDNAAMSILAFYSSIALLYASMPAPDFTGYAKDAFGKPLKYRLPGFRILVGVSLLYLASWYSGLVQVEKVWENFWSLAFWASNWGLVASFYFYYKGPFKHHVCAPKLLEMRKSTTPPFVAFLRDFFFGFELNPRFGDLDWKMYLYLIGSVVIHIVVITMAILEYVRDGSLSLATKVYVFEITWFLLDYVYHEHVHTYTYDLIDENIGFKLTWGCFVWYGFFYPVGAIELYRVGSNASPLLLVASVVMYAVGSLLTRGANLQKYYFKIAPNEPFMGIKPEAVGGKLLVNGWWGLARHVNYLGEILQGFALALPVGTTSWLPYAYPLYYIGLLFTRERDDDARCRLKYKKDWEEYSRRVPYRIIPYLY